MKAIDPNDGIISILGKPEIGGCKLTHKLGEGAFGAVYRGDHPTHGAVAVKILKTIADAGLIERFKRESKIASRLDTQAFVKVFDAGLEKLFFIVMEFVDGETLGSLVSRGAMRSSDAIEIMIDVVLGMASAHLKGIIHRDLKPENIMISRGGQVKIADLGMAGAIGPDDSLRSMMSQGGSGGTPLYMPPELWNNFSGAGPASDVFSLGLILGFTLKGDHVLSPATIPCMRLENGGISLRNFCDETSSELERIFSRATAYEQDKRYPNAGDFAVDLRQFERGLRRSIPPSPRIAEEVVEADPWASTIRGGGTEPKTRASSSEERIASEAVEVDHSVLTPQGDTEPKTRVSSNEEIFEGLRLIGVNKNSGLREFALKLDESVILVEIPGGSFMMGAEDGVAYENEKPVHKVNLSPFLAAKHPTTVGQYRRFCEQTGHPAPSEPYFEQDETHPVVSVSWHDAKAYANWAGLNLPTESQWEYACRAGTTTAFSFGAEITKELANFGREFGGTTPVGKFEPNPFGLYDMRGNVLEWCRDGQRAYDDQDQNDPLGPMDGESWRVIRGGSWGHEARVCRASCRNSLDPGLRNDYLGFRLFGVIAQQQK